jgi:deoxyribonuclease IV
VGVVLIGAHCSGGVKGALDKAAEMGAEAVQLFTQSPRAWRTPEPDPVTYERFRERREEIGMGAVVCHAIYLVNLAAPNDEVYEKSIATMRSTMQIACAIEADGVVFHVGSHLGSGFDEGLKRALPALEQVLELCSETTWLLMENSAGAGGTIGRSIEELATLFERLDRHPRLGLCLDSCHLFASGYDVTEPKNVAAVVKEVDAAIGLDRLRVLHVNDSQTPLGSNRDRHHNILDGLMGEGLGAFLSHPKLQKLPAILEVPGADDRGPNAEEIRKTRELHARWARKRKGKAAGASRAKTGARRSGSSGSRQGARRTRG